MIPMELSALITELDRFAPTDLTVVCASRLTRNPMLVHPVVRATGTIRRRRTTNKDLSTPRTVSWLRLPPSVLRPASVGRDARRARLAFTLLHTKIYVRNFARKHNVKGEVFAQTHREEGLLATGTCVAVSPPLNLELTFDSSINASHFDVPSCHSATLRPSLVRRNGILHPSFAFLLSSSCSCVVAL